MAERGISGFRIVDDVLRDIGIYADQSLSLFTMPEETSMDKFPVLHVPESTENTLFHSLMAIAENLMYNSRKIEKAAVVCWQDHIQHSAHEVKWIRTTPQQR